jgi:hypothetical protein
VQIGRESKGRILLESYICVDPNTLQATSPSVHSFSNGSLVITAPRGR